MAASDCVPGASKLSVLCAQWDSMVAADRGGANRRELMRLVGDELTAAWVSDRGSSRPFSGLQGQAEVVRGASGWLAR
jgi:hypothetical protein